MAGEITSNRPPVQHCGNHTFSKGDLPAALDRASIALPTLTRRRDLEAADECWHVYYGDVRAGTIAKRIGIPCACRKSNPNIFVVQSAEDWAAKNAPCPLHGAR